MSSRTPLTPVLLAASALEASPELSEETREQIRVIRRNVELETQLIDDLLDMTRVSKGKLAVKLRKADVETLVERSIQVVQERAKIKGVQIHLLEEASNCQAHVDRRRLKQVFWNLLSNAVKLHFEWRTDSCQAYESVA